MMKLVFFSFYCACLSSCRQDYFSGIDNRATYKNASGFNIASITALFNPGEPTKGDGEITLAYGMPAGEVIFPSFIVKLQKRSLETSVWCKSTCPHLKTRCLSVKSNEISLPPIESYKALYQYVPADKMVEKWTEWRYMIREEENERRYEHIDI